MSVQPQTPAPVPLGTLLPAAFGYAGLATCITLLFHGMRAVLAIGGSCGEGGPYVWAVPPCPDAAVLAVLGGIFGLFVFGGLAMVFGARIDVAWGAAPVLLGWVGLFGSLGWNFLDYGLFNPPDGSIEWGLVFMGVTFELMAWVPAVFVARAWMGARGSGGVQRTATIAEATTLPGPSQPARVGDEPARSGAITAGSEADAQEAATLQGIAAAMGVVIADAAATTPAAPMQRESIGDADGGLAEDFSEGTQALLDRLERLADMRDRGLLDPEEYETAKEAIVRELETRQ